ncbi:(d)CMP kinase [Flavobacteriaceae bacterium]|jgi:cytidylate kinase|uniref:(d)CMP kinase n=1 Tax=Candidatus Arcticimaribacter forsetii TaxID=2820661 RepID=UPI0020772235|nr:(d)CMP kinase [Candidatus Arcticimaribacter forsetii]MDA8640532.1 (d)CMP kinase [Flavobacteriaceae bacterium]MDA8698829.1 (d)CMP kinase [Flavobacteriaceae bacterium]MDB2456661.1 (d)CMP kinase [Flavobacteriaceae bacterium]MDB4674249.1 (d)CMP kinase [Flavobacteriaceae bacterium]MDB4717049.1 (d)CMP kinase [Flavobacteriaceae bacterium]
MKTTVIAVDGYASTGKSTLSKRLASELNFTYIDTGYMYRVVSYFALNNNLITNGVILEDQLEVALAKTNFTWSENSESKQMMFNGRVYGDEIRTLEISTWVSRIAQLGFVREHLVNQQRILSQLGSVVMDGRDIGTVVFANADYKFFLTADPKVRAQRRYDELQGKGEDVRFDEILKNVVDRDHQDSTRAISPLKKAADAIEIDTTLFSVEEVFQKMVSTIKSS